jgi:hypothetical protein
VTRHRASSTIVFSHWKGSLCTASTPVRLTEASRLIELLVGALRDMAEGAPRRPAAGGKMSDRFERAWSRLQPNLAAVSDLFSARRSHSTGPRQERG